jgi:hypothetical protein
VVGSCEHDSELTGSSASFCFWDADKCQQFNVCVTCDKESCSSICMRLFTISSWLYRTHWVEGGIVKLHTGIFQA